MIMEVRAMVIQARMENAFNRNDLMSILFASESTKIISCSNWAILNKTATFGFLVESSTLSIDV